MPISAALVFSFAGKSVATATISSLVTTAFNYLNEYSKSEGMEEVRNRLLQAMPKIQAVFDVVIPERIREESSSAMDAWLWQLRDAVEEAEDAIDELEYFELEEKAKDQKVSDWGSSSAKMKRKVVKSVKHVSILDKTVKQFTRHGTLKRLRKAVDSLDKAAAGVAVFLSLTDHLKGVASSIQQRGRLVNNDLQTGSTLSATIFVGREKEKEQIIGWLTKTSVESAETVTSTNSVPIISVVGHGGMGKTTLAQSICEEDEVQKHFKIIWVTVSTSFDATSVTSKILECATGAKSSANDLEPLQQDLKKELKKSNKSFLLVLDDVWEDKKRDEWEKLFAPLRKVKSGGKILLTTRMRSVADMAANVMGVERDQCLTLEGLEEDENTKLFNHHVFSGLNPQNYVYLKLTGEQIAKKLGGCPLVTKVVGGHLQANITLAYWSRFLHEELEHFKATDENIMKVLRLSYYHLPTDLQICFRYCSLFPEDHEFQKKELVQMWMGSGLISLVTSGSQTLEDIGEQFLDQLTRKSFFDHKSRSSIYEYDNIKQEYYVMHDLMHELARNVSYGECTRITDPGRFENVKDTVRHLCIARINSFSVEDVKKISQCKNLRTIIVDGPHEMDKDIVCTLEKIVETSKSLRLFHSNLENTFHFANKFGNLRHLRYIYLDQISPEGICGVVKLYHLILLHCHNGLQRETKQVRYLGNLEQLRYVSYGIYGFGEFPITRLTSLRELKKYRVQGSVQGSRGNKISAIGALRYLRELEVQGLDNVQNHEEARNAKLKEKQHLHSLSLDWSPSTGSQIRTDELVLDHLEPHGNIRELQISGYVGPKLPFWIENLSNMVSLTLVSCINWEHIPSFGELVLLKHLILINLHKLQQIGRSSHMSSGSGMELLLPPSLDKLVVRNCEELRELPILPPTLVHFEIDCVGLTKLPLIGSLCSNSTKSKPSQLLHIRVEDCPYLTSLEESLLQQKQYMGALRDLRIINCVNLESASLPFEEMNELEELSMGPCGELELGSLQRLTNLYYLALHCCWDLVSLPSADVFNTSLKSLWHVEITGCENLSSLGGLGSLPFLDVLEIRRCSKLTEVGSSHQIPDASDVVNVMPSSSMQISHLEIDLPSLLLVEPLKSLCHSRSLKISDGSEMESLPEWWLLQNRSSLQFVFIYEAKSLESLPPSMRDLSSLKDLYLHGAGKLRFLPDLPSSLQLLYILGCDSELGKKSGEHGTPEWNTISRIRQVQIGDSYFIMGKECSEETFDRPRSSGVPVVSDQITPEDLASEDVPAPTTSQDKVPEKRVVDGAPESSSAAEPAQDPLVILTPSVEIDTSKDPAPIPASTGNSSQTNKFPFSPRFIEDKDLNEVWGKILDHQAMTGPDTIFAEYNDVAIRHMVENFTVVGGLTQRIKDIEKKHSELKNLEKIKEEVVSKDAKITQLEEEIQAKSQVITFVTDKHKQVVTNFEKKMEEQTQALHGAKKALEFEQEKEAAFVQGLDEKIYALNKMIFDMGSGSSLPTLRDPTEKLNYLGQLLEDLNGLLKTTRENYVQTMKKGVASGVSYALAKLKASDPSINLQAVEEDFNCLSDEATKFMEELRPLGDKVVEEMEVESPSSSK